MRHFQHGYNHYYRPRMFPKFFFGMLMGGFIGYAVGRSNNQPYYGPGPWSWNRQHHYNLIQHQQNCDTCNQHQHCRGNFNNNFPPQPYVNNQHYQPQQQQPIQGYPQQPSYNPINQENENKPTQN